MEMEHALVCDTIDGPWYYIARFVRDFGLANQQSGLQSLDDSFNLFTKSILCNLVVFMLLKHSHAQTLNEQFGMIP